MRVKTDVQPRPMLRKDAPQASRHCVSGAIRATPRSRTSTATCPRASACRSPSSARPSSPAEPCRSWPGVTHTVPHAPHVRRRPGVADPRAWARVRPSHAHTYAPVMALGWRAAEGRAHRENASGKSELRHVRVGETADVVQHVRLAGHLEQDRVQVGQKRVVALEQARHSPTTSVRPQRTASARASHGAPQWSARYRAAYRKLAKNPVHKHAVRVGRRAQRFGLKVHHGRVRLHHAGQMLPFAAANEADPCQVGQMESARAPRDHLVAGRVAGHKHRQSNHQGAHLTGFVCVPVRPSPAASAASPVSSCLR